MILQQFGCSVYAKGGPAQLIANATTTVVPFDSVVFDNGGFFNLSRPSRIVIPATGLYNIAWSGAWQGMPQAFTRQVYLYLNDVFFMVARVLDAASSQTEVCQGRVEAFRLKASDELEMRVYQNTGNNVYFGSIPGGDNWASARVVVRMVGP